MPLRILKTLVVALGLGAALVALPVAAQKDSVRAEIGRASCRERV